MNWKKTFVTGILLVGIITAKVFALNKLINHISTKYNLLKANPDNFYKWRFGSIYYTKKGGGKPILLIHDTNVASSEHEWHKVISDLSQTNTVYAIDLLGCGRSDKPSITYTNFLYVQMISDFIKNVIGKKTDVIATGISGTFTLAACANDNTIIDKVIMVNPQDLVELAKIPTKRGKTIRYLISLPIFGTLIYNLSVNIKTIQNDFMHRYYYNANKVSIDDMEVYFEASQKNNANSKYLYASIISRFINANVIHQLKNTTNSVFILVGDEDHQYHKAAIKYQEFLPAIEIIGLSSCTYLPQLEAPRKFVDQVKILFDL
ncbi:MAG: alpha/beta fold hydrolase [Lachnospiraceae bacterium]|nr:alpha/beta fold hydrolase [Lachnospiraceae bacterium]